MKSNEPFRIAQILSKMNSGGIEMVVLNYYRHINRTKVQFDFIVEEGSTIPYRDEIEKMGGKIYLVPSYTDIKEYQRQLISLFKRNDYKIVHVHMNALSIFPLRAAKMAGVPIRIAHNHSTASKNELKRTVVKYILRPLAKVYPTHFCACSALAGKWLFGKRFYDQGNVKLIPNAIDISKFSFNQEIRNRVRKELNVEDSFVIGHVGRFMKQKNHNFLVDIFKKIHEIDSTAILLLAGEGELKEEIENKVRMLGLKDSVCFLGVQNNVHELMQGMDIFLLPSLYEGLPVVGVEAQSAGLPCVYADTITEETKILDSTEFVSLKESVDKWADKVLHFKDGFERKKVDEKIIDSGFQIKKAAENLCNYYLY
ncbi:glycosyltransferase family 1 protein [Desulfosporosinus nitroreducens]|uniref:glycosyltransferase family 1 protein n=1 Tax=Desulfosporosinus nitroreducens TaxID=2018668 RepID=UPI00207C1E48|nr:glycosyltransferase family 1 protein [Desulfosporosinus nitroreducens]MCO1600976.1 glycosyltransferase family 1 protein [Desulfosporosinus nitroreducens]